MAIHIVPTGANTFSNWKQKNIACASIRSTPHAILVCIRPLRNDLAIFLIFKSAIQCKKKTSFSRDRISWQGVFIFHFLLSNRPRTSYSYAFISYRIIASWHQQNIHIISHKNMPVHSSWKFSVFLYTQPSFPLIFWNSDPRGTSVCHLFQNNVFKKFYWNYLK